MSHPHTNSSIPFDNHDELQHGDVVLDAGLFGFCPLSRRHEFRHSPVPHTGHRHPGHWFRRPRTTAAKRAAERFLVEGHADHGIASMRRLPTQWDDIHRTDVRVRSWKRHRDTQHH